MSLPRLPAAPRLLPGLVAAALLVGLAVLTLTAGPASAQQDLTGIDPTGQSFTIAPGDGFESIGIGGGVSVEVSADSGVGLVLGVNTVGVDHEFVCSDLERTFTTGTVVTIGCPGDDITDTPGTLPVGLGCMEPPCTMTLNSLSAYPFAFIGGNILGAEVVSATVVSYTPYVPPETTTTEPTSTSIDLIDYEPAITRMAGAGTAVAGVGIVGGFALLASVVALALRTRHA